jgi:hypothetical protein
LNIRKCDGTTPPDIYNAITSHYALSTQTASRSLADFDDCELINVPLDIRHLSKRQWSAMRYTLHPDSPGTGSSQKARHRRWMNVE